LQSAQLTPSPSPSQTPINPLTAHPALNLNLVGGVQAGHRIVLRCLYRARRPYIRPAGRRAECTLSRNVRQDHVWFIPFGPFGAYCGWWTGTLQTISQKHISTNGILHCMPTADDAPGSYQAGFGGLVGTPLPILRGGQLKKNMFCFVVGWH